MKRTKIKFDEYQKKAFTTACSTAINSAYMVAGLARVARRQRLWTGKRGAQ